ncbi:aspartate aminotransferase family protein [Candidatus Babeliales bacterium]|nr:aspartate aminotransferase family protein [Candidatus Babeliales bacterium]
MKKKRLVVWALINLATVVSVRADREGFIEQACELFREYVIGNEKKEMPVVVPLSPAILQKKIDLAIGLQAKSESQLLDLMTKYLKYSVRTNHKKFCNQTFSGSSDAALLGEVITALSNTSMYTYEAAPVATLIEATLLNKLCSLVGFENGEGTFVTGGSNANLVALLAARNAFLPRVKAEGLYRNRDELVLFVSDQAHYSFQKAAHLLGLGENNVVSVATNEQGRMRVDALEDALQQTLNEGKIPFFVAATIGTTVLGAIDPLIDIVPVARQYNLWLHVDAAFGGANLLSSTRRVLLAGIEQAHSVAWDFHKVLSVPLICSAILFNKEGILLDINKVSGTEYIFHEGPDTFDLGHFSLQCGRRVDALKLWLDWQAHGDRGYEQKIDSLVNLAAYARRIIQAEPILYLICMPDWLPVCFQYVPSCFSFDREQDRKDIDFFNAELRKRLVKRGRWMINYSWVKERIVLRLTMVNPTLTNNDVDDFFSEVMSIGKELEKDYLNSFARRDRAHVERLHQKLIRKALLAVEE